MNGSVLWKLEHPDGRIGYLLGTMHVKDNAAYAHVEKALDTMSFCTHYFGEIDLTEATDIIQPEDYLIPGEQSLESLITPRHFKRMSKILQKAYELELKLFSRLYPLMLINQISELLLQEDNTMSLDQFLWTKAMEQGKTMGGVEAVNRQIEILHSLDLNTQLKALKDLCQNVRKFNKSVLKMVKLYEQANIQAIFKMSKKQLGALRKIMLYERNSDMASFIDAHQFSNAFFAIGAAHLGGDKGVLNLLKKKSWRLTAW